MSDDEISDKGRAVIESGLSVRQAHEVETGCSPKDLCSECREYFREEPS